MSRHFLKYLFSGLISSFLMACDKEERTPYYTFEDFSPGTLEYAYYKTGLYWIYEDTAKGDIDSHFIDFDTFGVDLFEDKQEEFRVKYEFAQYHLKATLNFKVQQNFSISLLAHNNVVDIYNTRPTSEGLRSHLMIRLPEKGKKVSNGLSMITIREKYDTFRVNDRLYLDVLEVHDSINYAFGGRETVHFLAKHEGVIRWQINMKEDRRYNKDEWQVWDLVRHKAVQ